MPTLLGIASLVTLVIQNTALVLLLRYSRTMEGPRYLSSTAVAMMEIAKFVTCVLVVAIQSRSIRQFSTTIKEEIIDKPFDFVRLSIPSLLYTVQNNLLFLALTNLDAVVYQMCYQLKILTTAVFSVWMLDRTLGPMKWIALLVLTIGVGFVQISSMTESNEEDKQNAIVGFVAVLLACVTSGFSGVYFEKILKSSVTTLWIRNIQMGTTSILLSLVNVYTTDLTAVKTLGFFHGYNSVVWGVIALQAFGGLTVAFVVKYADNILKGFAASYSILVSLLLEMFLLGFRPSMQFIVGGILVNVASYLYGLPDPPKRVLPI
eukprot:c7350_g1_i1.p1 GENE.c7350_g1_i1~~c7350_g1_i1.p1  ORF type:complete len:331 (-),score=81.32 c7350_g1_i1:138-1094(-)